MGKKVQTLPRKVSTIYVNQLQISIIMKYTALIIASLSFSSLANANDSAAVRLGGRLEYKKTNAIAMLTEDLFVSAHKVRVNYTFRNESDLDIEEIIAFPVQEEMWEEVDLADLVKQIDFKLTSDAPVSAVEHEAKMSGDHLATVVFHWKQKFPAGKIVTVSHEYQASGGFITPKSAAEWGKDWKTIVDDYCIEPKLNAWIFQHGSWAEQVHYILTTGANWKAPIEHFKLTVKKDTPAQRVSLCADNIKKLDDTTFQMEQTNFLPTRDLRVLFINSND